MTELELSAWAAWLAARPCLDRIEYAVHDRYSLFLGQIFRLNRGDNTRS